MSYSPKYAMYFDGNSYVQITSAMMDFSKYDAYTVMVWVMRTATGPGGFAGYQPGGAESRSPSMYFYPTEKDFHFGHGDGNTWYNTVVYGVLTNYKWFHLAIRWSLANGIIEGFVNGSNVGNATAPNRPYSNPAYWIGHIDSYHIGYIAQVLIYNRSLSDSEITLNYNNPDNPVRDDLILWLQADPAYVKDIDGDGILEWIDLSGNGNYGKIYGAWLVQFYAMYFDGSSNYVSVNFRYQFTAITILAWVNYPNSPYGSTCIRGAGGDSSRDWDIGVGGTTFWWTLTNGSSKMDLTSDFSSYINSWVMIWGRYDGSVMSMGINDKQTNSTSFNANLNQGINNPTFIMCRKPPVISGTQYKQGYLASILIYNRALSDSEIQWNYQHPYDPVRNGLVLWFVAHPDNVLDIDNDGIPEWVDLTCHGCHGKIYGAQLVYTQ